MSKYKQHQNHLNKTTLYLQKKFPHARFFSRHVGKFLYMRFLYSLGKCKSLNEVVFLIKTAKNTHMISINQKGMADQYMIYPLQINNDTFLPLHIEIETKTGSGTLSEDQKRWAGKCKIMGVPFFVSRCEKQLYKEISEYIEIIKSNFK